MPYAPPVALMPDSLRERYHLRRALGQGAMGAVLLAEDAELGREVAIKLIRGPETPEARRRFRREAQALAAMEHPHVLRVYDFGEAGEGAYLITEYVAGASLDRVDEVPELRERMLEVAEALDALHVVGLVHRDVKPGNILLSEEGRAVLIDLGLVAGDRATMLTETGMVVGTPAYLAPEVLSGEDATPSSDWYAWGATWFTVAEGRFPHDTAVLMAALRGAPLPAPEIRGASLSPSVQRLLRRCLAKDPAERPTGVGQVREILRGEPAAPPPEPPTDEVAPGGSVEASPRAPKVWSLGVAGLLGLLVLLGVLWPVAGVGHPPEPSSPPPPVAPSRLRSLAIAVRDELGRVPEIDRDPLVWPDLARALPSLPALRGEGVARDLHRVGDPDRVAILELAERFERLGLPAPLRRCLAPWPSKPLETRAIRKVARRPGPVPETVTATSTLAPLEGALRQVLTSTEEAEAVVNDGDRFAEFLGTGRGEAVALQLTGRLKSALNLATVMGRNRDLRLRWIERVGPGLEAMERVVHALGRAVAHPGLEAEVAAQVAPVVFGGSSRAFLVGPLFLEGVVPPELATPRNAAAWMVLAELQRGMRESLEEWDVDLDVRESVLEGYRRSLEGPIPSDPAAAEMARARRVRARVEVLEGRVWRCPRREFPEVVAELEVAFREIDFGDRGALARLAAQRVLRDDLFEHLPDSLVGELLRTLAYELAGEKNEGDRSTYAGWIRKLEALASDRAAGG
jgi:serine/threonine-protein kinase